MTRERTSVRRHVALGAALTMTIALLPASPAAAAGAYWDDDTSVHERAVEGLAAAGVTRSCDPETGSQFCPDRGTTRGEMAAFLNRALDLPRATRDWFTDDDGTVFEDDINRLAEAGITTGCNPPDNDEYCPTPEVTRGQMAAFLDRSYGAPDSDQDAFIDDDDSVFEGNINAIAAAGITLGCNPPDNDEYCPEEPVRRDQMASFLVRADDDLDFLDPQRLHERTITYEVDTFGDTEDSQGLLPLLSIRAKEALYADLGWNIQHRLLIEEVDEGGDFTMLLTDPDDIDEQGDDCTEAWSCTVGDEIFVHSENLLDRPATFEESTDEAYQRYVVMHWVGHWLDFEDTADDDDPRHYNDEIYCVDRTGDGVPEAPVMKRQVVETGECTTNVHPLPFERDCVEEAWIDDTTNQGDGDADIDDQCPHEPVQR